MNKLQTLRQELVEKHARETSRGSSMTEAHKSEDLRVCPDRSSINRNMHGTTGVYVRARGDGDKWGSYDIAELDRSSLHRWLRSRGGKNLWAENTVLILLGHPQVAAEEDAS